MGSKLHTLLLILTVSSYGQSGDNLDTCYLLGGVTLNRKAYSFMPKLSHNNRGNQAFLRTFHLWYSTFYFSSFFPQISFTYHKIRHFKLWSPMVFSIFTGFYNHHHSHIPECLYHPKKTPHYSLSPLPHIPKPLTYSLFGFAFSRHFIFI